MLACAMRKTLLVFTRAPRLGAVKRRLAAGIGALGAWRFHRLTVARLLRRLAADRRWRVVVALTPDRARLPHDWPRRPRLGQGGGDLGRRMARALAGVPAGAAVLVGGDIPALSPAAVAPAFRALAGSTLVFGPAEDGGYWLVGRRGRPPLGLFRRVRWSSRHALADTRAGLAPARRGRLVGRLADVDDVAGWRVWRDQSLP